VGAPPAQRISLACQLGDVDTRPEVFCLNSGLVATSHSWMLRQAGEGDVDELIALHQRVFHKQTTRERWLWKLGRPRGPVANVWVVEADGRLIFQYAGIPTRVRHCGTECWAMVSVDTMTDPDYRRRGLLTSMGAATYAHWREAGIPFVLGLPNEQWGSRSPALGFTPVSELRWWVCAGTFRRLAAKAGMRWPRSAPAVSAERSGPCQVLPLNDPSPFDELWHRIGEEGVVRDAAWFRWRYLEAVPRWHVLGAWRSRRLVGGAAFRVDANRENPSGTIGEVLASDFATLRLLLAGCREHLRSMGAMRAALLIQPGSSLEEAALASGFLPRPFVFSVRAVDLGGGLPRAARFHGGDFDVV
jgi:hypothetical protein